MGIRLKPTVLDSSFVLHLLEKHENTYSNNESKEKVRRQSDDFFNMSGNVSPTLSVLLSKPLPVR